jgi:hypothetical protein
MRASAGFYNSQEIEAREVAKEKRVGWYSMGTNAETIILLFKIF